MTRFAAGTRLGRYEILGPLGAGGMGEVYRARDPRLGRDVALKVLPQEVAERPDRLARFEREAKTIASLNHPNIVTIHSIEDAGGTQFLTMEVVEGTSLTDLIPPEGLPVKRALELSIALAEALAAAHARGVVHRDLKPSNVMVTVDDRVKVLDFGLAKLDPGTGGGGSATPEPTQALTVEAPISTAGQVVGTAPYMSPEQLRGETVDARSDVFALGILIYEMLAGRRPFVGDTFADLSSSILRDRPTPLRSLRGELPAEIDRLLDQLLEKQRERRSASAAVRDALEALRREIESSPPADVGAAVGSSAPTIAVLPFANLSTDPENEFFSDGLSEELLNVLARNPGLQVTGRTSSFAFKGKREDLREIGQKLGVANLLEGSVRRAGNRVRITAQLVKASDGFHLWSETYDRVVDDIFAVQDDIARAVSEALDVALLGRRPKAHGKAENFEVLIRAHHFRRQHTKASLERASRLYEDAVGRVPDDSRAWAGLSSTLLAMTAHGFTESREGLKDALVAAEKAMALDSQEYQALETIGWVRAAFERRWSEARDIFRRAHELAPSDGSILVAMATIEGMTGRLDEAIRLGEQAVSLDPLDAATQVFFGRILTWARDYQRAHDMYVKALELSPGSATAHAGRAYSLIMLGRQEEAVEEAAREESVGYRSWGLAVAHHACGDVAKSRTALDTLMAAGEEWAFQIATVHAMRGEADDAFRWLERARDLRDPGLPAAAVGPWFDSLHDDPRWPTFLASLGLEPV